MIVGDISRGAGDIDGRDFERIDKAVAVVFYGYRDLCSVAQRWWQGLLGFKRSKFSEVEKIAALGGQKSGLGQFFRTDPSNRGEERGDGSGRRKTRLGEFPGINNLVVLVVFDHDFKFTNTEFLQGAVRPEFP